MYRDMSNSELRRVLVQNGVRVGPITARTRNAYETKCANLGLSSSCGQSGGASASHSYSTPVRQTQSSYSQYSSPALTRYNGSSYGSASSPSVTHSTPVQSMSNAELRRTLIDNGVRVGPITEKTRNAYENKYLNLGSSAGESIARTPSASSKAGYSYVSASPRQTVPSSKQQPVSYSKSSVESMSNVELRRTLVEHGVGVGPITEKTRKAYENKVFDLGSTSGTGLQTQPSKAKATDQAPFPATYSKSVVEGLSNADLRRILVGHGVGVGPVTEKTRNTYENKVLDVAGSQPPTLNIKASAQPEQQRVPPMKQQSVPSAYAQSVVVKISNADLRRTLIEHGVRVGPITAKTRKAYENRYLNLGTSSRNTRDEKDRPVSSCYPRRSFWEYERSYVLPYIFNNVPQGNTSQRVVNPTHPSRCSFVKAADLVRSSSGGDDITHDHIRHISCDNNVLKIECTSSPVLAKMNDSRKIKESFDVLKVGDKEFHAHKAILSAFSPFFEAFISNRWTEACQPSIELKTVGANILELILDFAYSKSIEIPDPDVPAMLEAGSFFQVEPLLSACCEYLGKCLNAENCLSIDSLSVLFSGAAFEGTLLKLHEKARNYAIENFSAVCQQSDFLELESRDLIDIISNDLINVDREEVVFEAVLRWLHHNVKDRYLVLNQVMLVHDLCSESQIQTVGCFDQFGDKICHLPMPPNASRNIFVASSQIPHSSNHDIKILARFANDIWRYDFQLADWKQIPPMLNPRHSFGVCELDSSWYAVGGTTNQGAMNGSVEKYSPATNSWLQVTSLSVPVSNPSVVSVNGKLLVLGGLKVGDEPCDKVQQFNPFENIWSAIDTLPVALKCPSACVLDGDIYIGSEDTGTRVFVYNVSSNEWKNCQELPFPFLSGPVTVNGDVYVLTKSESKSSWIVRYVPSTDSWK